MAVFAPVTSQVAGANAVLKGGSSAPFEDGLLLGEERLDRSGVVGGPAQARLGAGLGHEHCPEVLLPGLRDQPLGLGVGGGRPGREPGRELMARRTDIRAGDHAPEIPHATAC